MNGWRECRGHEEIYCAWRRPPCISCNTGILPVDLSKKETTATPAELHNLSASCFLCAFVPWWFNGLGVAARRLDVRRQADQVERTALGLLEDAITRGKR